MSFVDSFFNVLGSAAGSAVVGGVMDLFTDSPSAPAGSAQVTSAGGGGGSSALSATMDQAKLAQTRASAGIAHGKATEAFTTHEKVNQWVNSNVDHNTVRKVIVANLIKSGAPPEMISNFERTMAASEIQPRQKAPNFPQQGFVQPRATV